MIKDSISTHEHRMTTLHHKIVDRKDAHMSWIESVTDYASENKLDVEDIVPLLSPFILARIREEAESLRLIKGKGKDRRFAVAVE